MNVTILIGRLTKDVDLKQAKETSVGRFSIAVDRKFKAENQPTADFINCVAFGKNAEFISKYFQKGSKIGITGHIQTGSYEKDGSKVFTTDVIVDSAEFVESLNKTEASAPKKEMTQEMKEAANEGFMQIDDDLADEGLPFR